MEGVTTVLAMVRLAFKNDKEDKNDSVTFFWLLYYIVADRRESKECCYLILR